MRSMYRYSKRQFSKLLLEKGNIRIGTLHDFRRSEHKRGISDPQEGKKEVSHRVRDLHIDDLGNVLSGTSKDADALKAFGLVRRGPGAGTTIVRGAIGIHTFDQADCFVLCTSKTLSREIMLEFEGADSCVRIVDIANFYNRLTVLLQRVVPVTFRGIHEIRYQDRREAWNGRDWGFHPALIKEVQFKKQSEIRAIWAPAGNRQIEPVIVEDPWLRTCCVEVEPECL